MVALAQLLFPIALGGRSHKLRPRLRMVVRVGSPCMRGMFTDRKKHGSARRKHPDERKEQQARRGEAQNDAQERREGRGKQSVRLDAVMPHADKATAPY